MNSKSRPRKIMHNKNVQLEIDVDRGVIYGHVNGITKLRICGLKIPKSFGSSPFHSIDISLKFLKKHPVLYNCLQEPSRKIREV